MLIHAVRNHGHWGTWGRGGVGTDPDPHRGGTNEATPRGESPEAIRPDTEGEETPRGESPEAIRPDTEDTHAHARACHRLADPPWSESARRPFPGLAITQHTSSVTILSSTATGLDTMLLALVTAYWRRLILRD